MITDESGYTSGFETTPSPQQQMRGPTGYISDDAYQSLRSTDGAVATYISMKKDDTFSRPVYLDPPPQEQMTGWQDISTAPIGKSVIICTWWKHSPSSAFRAEGYLDRDTKTWRNQDGSPISEDRTQPTHWQSISDAPTLTTEGQP